MNDSNWIPMVDAIARLRERSLKRKQNFDPILLEEINSDD